MSEVKLVKLKLKKENKQIWFDWCEELKQRKDEVIETLKSEGVVSESCFLSDDEKFVYYFIETESFEKADKAYWNSEFKIDKEHREKRRLSLEKIGPLKELFHFENRS